MAERRAKMKYRSLERGGSAPHFLFTSESRTSMTDSSDRGAQLGHDFHKKTYYKPTYCQHCTDMLWGLKGQGWQCSVCNYISHERCIPYLMTSCAHVIANSIKDPVPHQWAGPKVSKKKKKWCNVCRLRINSKEYFCRVCRIYSHQHCKSDAFNNCKDCASYSTISDEPLKHHWIEGNLPSTSRCEQCGKSCFTDITLSGFRCGWCGITVHSSCRDAYELVVKNQTCNFRALWHMMLPPNAVSCPISIAEEQDEPDSPDGVDEILSPAVDEEDGMSGAKEAEGKGRPALIIDGSAGKSGYDKWRKRRLQPTYVPKEMTAEELLIISLRKCSVTDNFDEYYLTTTSSDGSQSILSSDDQPHNINPGIPGLLKLYIKKKAEASSKIILRIHNSRLSSSHKTVPVKIEQTTTTADIIKMALAKFEIEEDLTNYCLYEVSQDGGVSQRLMDEKEHPWSSVQQLTEDSIRSANLQRYYLHPKEQTITTLYLWNLSAQSLQTTDEATAYVKTLVANDDLIDNSVSIGPLFPTHGALFIEFKNSEQAKSVRSAVIANGHSCVKILPNIHESAIRRDQEPLLVFINARSGGNQGKELINSFQRHLNPHQVYDLAKGGPLPGLYVFQKVPSFRVLVGGGDGTVGWVLGGLDTMRNMLAFPSPPCATVPLGTGNDLARALKWGGGYTGEKVMQILFAVEDANVVNFDRWEVCIKETIPGSPPSSPRTGCCKTVTMNNYFGIGLDAEIALDFHNAREENPEKFNSRFHNKSVYFQLGVQKTFSRDNSYGLAKQITLYVDDKKLEIPRDMKGIVLLNIQSWGAGSEPWGSSLETGFVKNAYDDELLEVMGISGPVHIGQIKSGIKNGIRLAQGKKFTVDFHEVLPIQIDGEAWQQMPCCITVKRLAYQTTMLEKSSKRFYQARGVTTQHEIKDMMLRASVTAIDLTQLSSRRQYTPEGASVNSPVSGISHTLYRKLDEDEIVQDETEEKKTDL